MVMTWPRRGGGDGDAGEDEDRDGEAGAGEEDLGLEVLFERLEGPGLGDKQDAEIGEKDEREQEEGGDLGKFQR